MTIISISPEIKEEIARRFVETQHPGYSTEYMGNYYVVDGSQVTHAAQNRHWDPWHDGADVIAVDELIGFAADQENASFEVENWDDEDEIDATVSFVLGYVPDSYDTADTQAARYADG